MNELNTKQSHWQESQQKNTRALFAWTLAWLITLALSVFGSQLLWQGNQAFAITSVIVNLLIGIGMIYANKKHLQGLDEMQQKIQLSAMAMTLGVGLVVGLCYSTLSIVGVITRHAEIAHLIIIMGLSYLFFTFVNHKQYQ